MFARLLATLVVGLVTLIAGNGSAQHIAPSALLTIDQNRTTVVDRIVGEWGARLSRSSSGISAAQLREILSGLRADHLLAASLAGDVEGLRNVVAGALVYTGAAVSPGLVRAKSVGDAGDDLAYTPIVPCRILDTRNGTAPPYNSVMVGGSAFPVTANLANFAPQGGSATSCNLPASFAAIAVTLTVLNPNFDAFLAASSSSNFATLTQAVAMNFSANKGLANTAIVPVDGTVKFYLGLPAQVTTHVIADAVGYFRRPTNYGGTHVITGFDATDSGGFQNTASGDYSTVGGGYINTASRDYSTVVGGQGNTASGNYSTVAGGSFNIASGELSFAAGFRAQAKEAGMFVWADERFFNFDMTQYRAPGQSANTFNVRATQGVYFATSIDGFGAPTWACYTVSGQGWSCGSDRSLKRNLHRVDSKAALGKVAAMPIYHWQPKDGPNAEVRHLGPMAQDFHAAFGLGDSDKSIGMQDIEGVALAAIQGLNQMMQQKDREIAQLRRKLRAVETTLGLR